MCISAKVSMGAFILCLTSCAYLYKRNNINDRWVAILFVYLGSMQLLEYMMWMDQECKGLNQFATNLGFYHNILQPVISILVAYYYTNGKLPIYIYGIYIIYLVSSFPFIYKMKKKNQCSLPCKDSEIGLSWEYTNTQNQAYVWGVFCLAISLPLLMMKKDGYIYTGIIIGTYILSHFISKNRCSNTNVSAPNGSWWCILASLVPLGAIFINSK